MNELIKRKISNGCKRNGVGKWMTGRRLSEEIKDKMSKSHKGKDLSYLAKFNTGKHRTEETKRKVGEKNKINSLGNHSHLGFKHSEQTKQKLRSYIREKASNWRGGLSFEPYSVDWTQTLKLSIRERDHYICQICGKEPAICIHHIDYDKKNCNYKNLVTLCRNCHQKTNFKREYWIKYFKNYETFTNI